MSNSSDISSVAIVDGSLVDQTSLLSGINAGHILVLDPQQNGVEQISQILSQYDHLESIHIFSHGSAGNLQLGTEQLNQSNLSTYEDDLIGWGRSLSETGDLLLYGCNVAKGESGSAFVHRMSQLTQSDIAASDDLTGLGGDWTLEMQTGTIEAPIVVEFSDQNQYQGTLATTIGESGQLTNLNHRWQTVTLQHTYENPVVIAGPPSLNGDQPTTVRVRNVRSNSFQVRLNEWEYLDEQHVAETVGYVVMEAGTHTLDDGTVISAGTQDQINHTWETVDFGNTFTQAPVVLAQTTSERGDFAVTERIRSLGTNGFEIRLQEEEAADGIHRNESIGWLAIQAGSGSTGEGRYRSGTIISDHTGNSTSFNRQFAAAPVVLANMNTTAGIDPAALRLTQLSNNSLELVVEEETSADAEMRHLNETLGFLALDEGLIVTDESKPSSSEYEIDGAFSVTATARFDNLSGGRWQRVFDFGNGPGQDNILMSQVGGTNDMTFHVYSGGVQYDITAPGAIIEGETADWTAIVESSGFMRLLKNGTEVAFGQGAVPNNVDRANARIGASNWAVDTPLIGEVSRVQVTNSPTNLVDPEGDGQWSAVQDWPIIPIHSLVLPDGKVLSFGTTETGMAGGQFVYDVYDPETKTHFTLPNTTGTNIFCSQMVLDPATGNVIIMGGDASAEDPSKGLLGVNDVVIFDYRTMSLIDNPVDMNFDRWYSSVITLSNGDILTLGGRNQEYDGSTFAEVYNPDTGFRVLTGAEFTDFSGPEGLNSSWWYPHAWQRSDGQVVVIEGFGNDVYLLDVNGNGSLQRLAPLPFGSHKLDPAIMFDQDKVLMLGVDGGLWVGDLAGTPSFTKVNQLPTGRTDANLSILADGSIVITGGTQVRSAISGETGQNQDALDNAQRDAFRWVPSTNELIDLDDEEIARLYHSTGTMLPDGTVLSSGGGAPGILTNLNAQIFTPDILFNNDGTLAARPEILSATKNVGNNDFITMRVDNAFEIASVGALKSGGITHSRNTDGRFLNLDFEVVNTQTIRVQTKSANVMIPGLWMVGVVNNDGVPSESALVGVSMAAIS